MKLRLPIPDFEHLTIAVMRDGTIRQREFVHDRSVYRVRVNPYRTSEGSIEGVVAVILDMADFRKPVTAKQSRKRRSKG